ncbi:type VI secretion protein [Endozoicomonas sp. OPT23]|uniref:type VI secretion system contractile sheath domain-containing protein n=1 Tax=Endozoicomonas sp. OPT23 TaxID=2072845 RepID=UPI00129A6C92|nr:type VI secretion system contractile sheath large subunit [Endozoicomonas sp. OPT23]MRI33744.1 type VI secretion protein [Endozoicomonas sp. OPT23]
MRNPYRAEATVQKLVAAIDEMVCLQLSAIIQHPSFKSLESLWRGLSHLVNRNLNPASALIKILDMNWEEVADDLNLSNRFQSSLLYRLTNQQELNTLGGHPFGLLVFEHYVSFSQAHFSVHDEIYTLQLLSELGQETLCPVLTSAAPDFLFTDDLEVWSNPERISRILASEDFNDWRRLRTLPSSRFLGLALPQFLVRSPWKACYSGIRFDEVPIEKPDSHYLWGGSAFALAGNIICEFNRIHWFGFLRVAERGGALVNKTHDPSLVARVKITDRLGEFFSEQGFIPLETCYLDHHLAFFNNRSIYNPPAGRDDLKVISMLQTTLIGCRFGHYLKLLIRENIGSYDSAETCERQLNIWLQEYTSDVDQGSDEVLASYPLRKSRARIRGNKSLGIYQCEVELQPQYQFDFIRTSLVLKTDSSEIKSIDL